MGKEKGPNREEGALRGFEIIGMLLRDTPLQQREE